MSAGGWQCATIVDSDVVTVDGEVVLIFHLQTAAARRNIVDRIILDGPSSLRVHRGQKQLASLVRALGWYRPLSDSAQLHGMTCLARLWGGKVKYAASPLLVRLVEMPAEGRA